MGSGAEYLGTGGGRFQYLRNLLIGGSSGGALIWLGYVGDYPPYQPKIVGFPQQGGPPAGRYATMAQCRREMVLSTVGGGTSSTAKTLYPNIS